MAGIYIHIPFCKQACHYCNFHFSTSLKQKASLVTALQQEIRFQADFLEGATVETIYLGGGTPSLLDAGELAQIFETIYAIYPIGEQPEITLEANPDDLTAKKLQELAESPVNRLSIGIQSFIEEDLRFMNRAHNAEEAETCLKRAQDAGFEQLTADLIYGTPTLTDAAWEANLEKIAVLNIPHLSSYCLTVEPQTALAHHVATGKAKAVDEVQAARQFEQLMAFAAERGYIHYEISNFAKPDQFARHNSNYWKGVPYLGIGPSAHSFDGKVRYWNIAHNAQYIKSINAGKLVFEEELLTPAQRYNEYVMTGLRTIWGCDLEHIRGLGNTFADFFIANTVPFIQAKQLERTADNFHLTPQGKLLADRIAMELFWV